MYADRDKESETNHICLRSENKGISSKLTENEMVEKCLNQTWNKICVKRINKVINRGVFATELIKRNEVICDYNGKCMTREEMDLEMKCLNNKEIEEKYAWYYEQVASSFSVELYEKVCF